MVSIVTPMYNSAKFIETTIISVINQTYNNWELIIVDDCSTDKSIDIVRGFAEKDDRIKLLEQPNNQGAGVARNVGMDHAKGEFIAFLDADDYWDEKKIEIQVNSINKNQWAGSFSWYKNVNEDGNGATSFVVPSRLSFKRLRFNNYILTSSLMLKREVVKDVRFPLMRKRQDWIFFLEILKRTQYLYCVDELLVFYRKSSNSLSSNKLRLIKANFEVISNYFYDGNKLKGGLHFIIFLMYYFHNKLFLLRKTNQ
ncbi:glycosyltransferase family 2 protein [Carboxylicivirga sp. M1479]|uniref:glycosyltransferase family 2 protein n=1 Tax=Carboxylicivirga sp. M1479 TaxID=2594476 RepID=UPI00163D6C22|nr:glycosyltransferase family 2 protein [Carboxylicivirga sp. M1479]